MKYLLNWRVWAHLLFWSWNAIFLTFILMGFTPLILIELVRSVSAGWVPAAYLIYGGLIVLIPIISVALGFLVLRKHPGRLFALGYGVQGPLMVVLAVRFFAVRETMPPMALLLSAACIGIVTLLWQLLDTRAGQRGAVISTIRLIGLTALLMVGLYFSVALAFYALPVVTALLRAIGEFFISMPRLLERDLLVGTLLSLVSLSLGSVLVLYSGTLLVLMPIAVPIIYTRQWWLALRAASRTTRAPVASQEAPATATLQTSDHAAPLLSGLLTTIVAVGLAAGYVLLNQQPQRQAFALLETPPRTPEQAAALVRQEPLIRAGLLNAYLAPYRYVSSAGEVRHIRDLYEDTVGLSPETAMSVQQAYETWLSPLLYQPAQARYAATDVGPQQVNTADTGEDGPRVMNSVFISDAEKAGQLYSQYFDQPINKAERNTIVPAVRANWDVSRVTAAWQAVDDREILLTQQTITLTEREGGAYADVELYEVYENQTAQQQEVVYYFNLPESAVMTGLWLGDSDDLSTRFAYRISPRGAAQQIYREQVQIRRDPALLEQVGPRQYRLRVFPIEPRQWRGDSSRNPSTAEQAAHMHLWMTWRLLPENGAWVMPHLSEKRNVYWTDQSVRVVNGKAVSASDESWLPASLPFANTSATTSNEVPRQVNFANGQTVLAIPLAIYQLPNARPHNIAVVLDRSYSMARHKAAIQAALAEIAQINPKTDVYLTAPAIRGEAPSLTTLDALQPQLGQLVYFGGQDSAELLTQFAALRAVQSSTKEYDAVLVLTDDSGYELNNDAREVGTFNEPIWMVHLDGALPLGYTDKMLEAIQASGGGVVTQVTDAFARIAARIAVQQQPSAIADLSGDYAWLTLPTTQVASLLPGVMITPASVQVVAPSDPFATFAARRLVLADVQRNRGRLNQNETLDALHKIATEQSIVTPYSSMIVLVNDEQRRQLDELEKQGDRFAREKEAVGETNNGGQPIVTGVPEPHEWLLIGLAAAMLAGYGWRKRRVAVMR